MKNRVRVDGKIIAYEWVNEDGFWSWQRVNTESVVYYGTYPSTKPCIRERFTGKVDRRKREVFDFDKVRFWLFGNPKSVGIGEIYWSSCPIGEWCVLYANEEWSFRDIRKIEVIPEQSDEIQN